MKRRLQILGRRLRRNYRLFMAEYLDYFGMRNRPAPKRPELCLPF